MKHSFSKKNKIKGLPLCFKDSISFDVMGALNMSGRMLSKEIVSNHSSGKIHFDVQLSLSLHESIWFRENFALTQKWQTYAINIKTTNLSFKMGTLNLLIKVSSSNMTRHYFLKKFQFVS